MGTTGKSAPLAMVINQVITAGGTDLISPEPDLVVVAPAISIFRAIKDRGGGM